MQLKISFLVFSLLVVARSIKGGPTFRCPYGRPTTSFKNEVFAFMTTSDATLWDKLPWDELTTLGLFMHPIPDTLVCLAHKHNVRVIKAVDFNGNILGNLTARKEFIKQAISNVKQRNLDGLNVDFEESMSSGSSTQKELTEFMANLAAALHDAVPGSQISFDVPYSPDGIYGRNFDTLAFSKSMDYLVIMSYDEASGPYANSNSGYTRTAYGAQRYLDVGIPASQLILAFPWYGYSYTCSSISPKHVCSSDSSGKEIVYTEMQEYYRKYAVSDIMWDHTARSPYFDVQINGVKGQVRYDDPRSLRLKSDIALELGLLGVGMWTANYGDFNDTNRWNDMWATMPYRKSEVMSKPFENTA